MGEYVDSIDFQAVLMVGENFVSIVRGQAPVLHMWKQDGLHDRIRREAEITDDTKHNLFVFVGKLRHRYPHMTVLEIGAGTGGTTRAFWPFSEDARVRIRTQIYPRVSFGRRARTPTSTTTA